MKKLTKLLFSSMSVLVLSMFVTKVASANQLYFIGSTSVAPLIKASADAFKKSSGISISVRALGSSTGVKAAGGATDKFGVADIGMASRPMKDKERAKFTMLEEVTLAKDGLAFAVSKKNPLSAVTTAQIRDAFLKNGATWSSVFGQDFGGLGSDSIYLVSKDTNHGTFAEFAKFFKFNKNVNKSGKFAYFADKSNENFSTTQKVEMLDHDREMLARVKNIPNTLAYISLASIPTVGKFNAKVVQLDGVQPSSTNVNNGSYKLARPLNILINNDKRSDKVETFLQFTKTPEFKGIIESVGFVPAN